jgi:hypothetical protein
LILLLAIALARPGLVRLSIAAGVASVAVTLALFLRASSSAVARCEATNGGLVERLHSEKISEYAAPGLSLERLVCKLSFQYSDEETRLVYGKLPDGSALHGESLFARVKGAPLERARAARELLLSGDCDELISAEEALQYTPSFMVAGPVERDGKLIFNCLHHNYTYGRGTTVGMMNEPTRYVVDLRTLETSWERIR